MTPTVPLLLVFSCSCAVVKAPIPFIPAGLALGAAVIGAAVKFRCQVLACCDPYWIPGDITGLQKSFEERLFGQHLVIDTVVKSLRSHLRTENPSKALVLSFHGWTGGGKTFVSKMIAQNVFRLGLKSRYVHFQSATLHFPHVQYEDRYKVQLHRLVKNGVTDCSRSLFIFDEVEKMPVALLDSLMTFLDHHEQVDGVDYRKAMFIFISNAGGQAINRYVLEHWQKGNAREKIQLKDLESRVAEETYGEDGGLLRSQLIKRGLVSAFVPFLPLERSHVRLCVRDNLRSKNYTVNDKVIDEVLSEVSFFPEDTKLFSKKGCKDVSNKVNLVMEEAGRA